MCLAIFAGAQIAGANIRETAYMGVKMSAVPYLLPFLVIFVPPLLLIGSPQEIVLETAAAMFGLLMLIAAVQGWVFRAVSWPGRLLICAAGACLLWPDPLVKSTGLILGAVIVIVHVMNRRREAAHMKPS